MITTPIYVYNTRQVMWLVGEEICRLLGRFSRIVWAGDSMTRHAAMGMFMLMTRCPPPVL